MKRAPSLAGALALLGALGAVPPGVVRTAVAEERPPNLILVLTDDQTFDAIPRSPAVMPWLEAQVADPLDHWVRFTNAFVSTSLCCPARATLLTGQYSHHHGVHANKWQALEESNTLPTWLAAAGYRTGMFGKYMNRYRMPKDGRPPPGWDRWFARVAAGHPYYDHAVHDQDVVVQYGSGPDDYSTDVYADEAVEFVETTPSSQPFFLWFAPSAPHEPQTPAPRHAAVPAVPIVHPPNFNEEDVSDKPHWVRSQKLLSEQEIAGEDAQKQDGYRSLLAVDEAIERLVGAVIARGQLDDTVIVFLSDHGFSMREHRWHGKRCGYDSCTRIPLFIRVPGTAGNREISQIVSNVSLASTLAELAGVAPGLPQDGASLLPLIDDTAAEWPSAVLLRWAGDGSAVPPYWGARSLSHLYLEYETGEKELYDLIADPWLLENRAGDPDHAEAQAHMAETLNSLRGEPTEPRDTTPPEISIVTPAADASYELGSSVAAGYSCSDTGGSGLATCSGPVPNGAAIDTATTGTKTFTVNATDGAGNATATSHVYQVTSNDDGTTHTLTVTRSGSGVVRSSDSLILCGRDCTERYDSPTALSLNARPASGWTFVGWSGDVPATCRTHTRCDLTVSGDVNVTASFAASAAAGKPLP